MAGQARAVVKGRRQVLIKPVSATKQTRKPKPEFSMNEVKTLKLFKCLRNRKNLFDPDIALKYPNQWSDHTPIAPRELRISNYALALKSIT
jgi:hypothetical protein